jgi:16S rRNA (guanine527-N7)-methyltransferase
MMRHRSPAVHDGPALIEVLERARTLGVLGPGPVIDHIDHAERFVRALEGLPRGAKIIDLGSGGGVPGLVIADRRPDLRVVLLDSMQRRVALLAEAIDHLGWSDRVSAVLSRAETFGRLADQRGGFQAVTARSFGPPATVAECAAPLLELGGLLIVSEPPDKPDRWPAAGLAEFGLRAEVAPLPGLQVLHQEEPCPDRFPRRDGVPAKRPLF